MAKLFIWLIFSFWLSTATAQDEAPRAEMNTGVSPSSETVTDTARPNVEDMEIIAVMEILELMDLAEEMDMMKDLDYLIEEDQNEN